MTWTLHDFRKEPEEKIRRGYLSIEFNGVRIADVFTDAGSTAVRLSLLGSFNKRSALVET